MFAQHVRGLAALGRGDFEEAYQQLAAVSPPGSLAPHINHALRVPLDLVEAAQLYQTLYWVARTAAEPTPLGTIGDRPAGAVLVDQTP